MEENEKLLTIKEVAKYLGVSIAQVYRYSKQEEPLPIIKISAGTVRVKLADLREWIDKQTLN